MLLDMEFCPEGHRWIDRGASIHYSHHWYCPDCDEIYIPDIRTISKEELNKRYSSDRYEELKRIAKIADAKKKVTLKQLIELGLIEMNMDSGNA